MKKSFLPRVKNGTMCNLEHRLDYQSDKECYDAEIKEIKKENPIIARFINMWSKDRDVPKKARGYVAFCGILVYRMLASQAEADRMEEELGA